MAAATVTGWIDQHATPLATTDPASPLTELAPWRQTVGDAQVVGSGSPPIGATSSSPRLVGVEGADDQHLVQEAAQQRTREVAPLVGGS